MDWPVPRTNDGRRASSPRPGALQPAPRGPLRSGRARRAPGSGVEILAMPRRGTAALHQAKVGRADPLDRASRRLGGSAAGAWCTFTLARSRTSTTGRRESVLAVGLCRRRWTWLGIVRPRGRKISSLAHPGGGRTALAQLPGEAPDATASAARATSSRRGPGHRCKCPRGGPYPGDSAPPAHLKGSSATFRAPALLLAGIWGG